MLKKIAAALCLGLFSSAAQAATVDMFALDVRNSAGVDSTAVLEAGRDYYITVSGTVRIGNNPTRHIADAEYFNLGSTPLNPLNAAGSIDLGVGVDGNDIDFGAYNASNVYRALITGDGSTINVFFGDSAHGDNSGSLAVEISTVPLPAGMALMLTGFGAMGVARRRRKA